jgi:acyl-coenzyme A thioesterase PaaI-like protein
VELARIDNGVDGADDPVMPGKLTGVGRVVRWGKTVAFSGGEMYDDQGRLVAKATGTALPTPFRNYK